MLSSRGCLDEVTRLIIERVPHYFRKRDCDGLKANFDALLTIAETQAGSAMADAALEGGDYADKLLRKAGCY
jgi:hypothetical protein